MIEIIAYCQALMEDLGVNFCFSKKSIIIPNEQKNELHKVNLSNYFEEDWTFCITEKFPPVITNNFG